MAEIAEERYITPLAKWSRVLEIFIPGYMFGKAWGIANEQTVDLYKVIFPSFLIDMAEKMKGAYTDRQPVALERIFSTCSGALVGFLVILILGAVMHIVLGDRKYIDSLRFTSITLIPLAVMNGTLSHVTNTLLETLGGGETIEKLTISAVDSPHQPDTDVLCFLHAGNLDAGQTDRGRRQTALVCTAGRRRFSRGLFCFGPRNNPHGSG